MKVCQQPRRATRVDGGAHRDEGAARVAVAQGLDQFVEGVAVVGHATGRDHLVQRRERVASGATAGPQHVVARVLVHVEAGVGDDVVDQPRGRPRAAGAPRSAACGS